ncbi:Putative cytochrome C-type biogenesis protein [hydrothermal vent metagenome]|uniref:Putative cytochrome C-type biogenesis protein n=1 Tax=hydrothermal vent metagenome TaxID=652676 RepID=A0A1W1B920_9ZZZZ
MGKIVSFIGSMKSMAVLMLIFAVSIGYATFIENDYGTMTAKAEIYNTRWFEVLLGVLAINLIYNIYRYRMFSKKKIPIFIFHVAFLIILIGAAITRYIGFEGTMHIREGDTSSYIISSDPYIQIKAKVNDKEISKATKLYLSKRGDNSFEQSFKVDGKSVKIKLLEYIPDAVEKVVPDPNGVAMLDLMITGAGGGKPVALAYGNYYDSGAFVIDFGSQKEFTKPTIKIFIEDGKLYMDHTIKLSYFKMASGVKGELEPKKKEQLDERTLYNSEYGSFVLRGFYPKAIKKIISNDKKSAPKMMRLNSSGMDALKFIVDVDGVQKEILIFGQAGMEAEPKDFMLSGVEISLAYGAKKIELPFAIKLLDFKLERYPGSMSPASYESDVVLIDKKDGVNMPYRIYMNHVLDYKGYRFFQASYDRDERGTVLSVNHDPGTPWAYLGYLMLGIGFFWSFFSKNLRFSQLMKIAQKARDKKDALASLLAFVLIVSSALPLKAEENQEAIKSITSISKAHADRFGELVVQDMQGRMKPIDTLSLEVLAKVHRSATLELGGKTIDANQAILGMMVRPDLYKDLPIILTHDKNINRLIGAPEDAKYVSFAQFFSDPQNLRGYKILKQVDDAARKPASKQNRFDKKLIKIDERVNVVYMIFTGSLLKIWPMPHDPNNTWYDTITALQKFPPKVGQEVRDLALSYFSDVQKGMDSGKWSDADKDLANIKMFQKLVGKAVYPAEDRIKAEIFYNHANIFETIYPIYLLVGFILLILSFIKIVKPRFKIDIYSKITLYILIVLFIAHTIGLGLRWYISGHAPWSNGYESMIYIGWASVLAGFIFSKKSPITMAATGILTGLILFVAHLNWMNPQVTNLVPVLNSYWLSIHVSMITASYGFLGLGALLGFIMIILYMIKNEKNEAIISCSIIELNAINEMSLMIGLAMLTVGNFLGGVWANESWGRYWGWDPKETWALVTILVYAVVMHLRFIKSIYNEFNYSVISLLAFTSVLMTYFGVNYYLAGLHSYAKGDPVPVPDFVPLTYTILFLSIALAVLKDLRFHTERAKNHFYMLLLFLVLQGGNVYATYTSHKDILLFSAYKVSNTLSNQSEHAV